MRQNHREPQNHPAPMTKLTPGTIGIMAVAFLLMMYILIIAPLTGWGV